jgi:hypothetical protein
MTLIEIARRAEKFAIDNSPLLLTAAASAGVVTTAVLAGKASFKAADIIHKEETRQRLHSSSINRPELSVREQVNLTWKLYIPAATTGLLTVGAIVTANQIGTRRAAAMAAAYTISEKAFTEYKEKVVETFGEGKERKVRDDVAQDRVNEDYNAKEVIVFSGGQQICHDAWSDRFFMSDMESLKQAENRLNHQLISEGYASLSDFYDFLGLGMTQESDEIGWKADKLLDIHYTTTLTPDGKPAISLEYRTTPVRDYFRFR